MPPPRSAHGLGPHVVGQRVVVRRVVHGETGPSGGPAMTDVLGILVAWDSETCVVSPETGPAVTIPVADVVTGKPVPPRGSVRQRVTAREAELRALPLWASPTTESLGEWVLRIVTGERGRGSRRANSVLAIGDPGLPIREAAARVERFYAGWGRVATAQVEVGSDVDAALAAAGWSEAEPEDAPYLVGSLVMARRVAGSDDGVEIVVDGTRILATVHDDGREVGRVRGELNSDWLWVHGLRVDESHRRRGLGRALVAGLLDAGAETGAGTVWVEVDRQNTAAWMLYAGLGLREHHRCRYLQAPES
ncbi:MAG TPA: GNAT family N-acetyltransferase [Nocardioides sp.]|nr:GNAT family N-acetyltransferase [Nocardioides sp.]